MLKSKNRKRGFTLVEVIVVLVILAILAAIMIPALTGWIEKSKKKTVIAETRNLHQAVQAVVSEYYGESGGWSSNVKNVVIASSDNTAPDGSELIGDYKSHYNEVIKLSEIPADSMFFAIVNSKGKVQSLVYHSNTGYWGVYFTDTKEYQSYKDDELTTIKTFENKIISPRESAAASWSCEMIRMSIGLTA